MPIKLFQFHKGTIKTGKIQAGINPATSEFQFHKGTIKTNTFVSVQATVRRFQFHKGTIKTVIIQYLCFANVYFNSIKVRLKRLHPLLRKYPLRNFNSIKVRLKPSCSIIPTQLATLFQFHKGTIKPR